METVLALMVVAGAFGALFYGFLAAGRVLEAVFGQDED
jgi:hypothetical protein